MFFAGERGSSGSKNCRRAGIGRLLCTGEERKGRRQAIVLNGRMGDCGLEELPQGERRDTVLRGGAEGRGVGMGGGGRQEIVLSGRNGDFGLEALPLSWRKGVRCRRLAAERAPGYCSALGKERKGRRQEMVLSGRGGLE